MPLLHRVLLRRRQPRNELVGRVDVPRRRGQPVPHVDGVLHLAGRRVRSLQARCCAVIDSKTTPTLSAVTVRQCFSSSGPIEPGHTAHCTIGVVIPSTTSGGENRHHRSHATQARGITGTPAEIQRRSKPPQVLKPELRAVVPCRTSACRRASSPGARSSACRSSSAWWQRRRAETLRKPSRRAKPKADVLRIPLRSAVQNSQRALKPNVP